MTSWKQSPRCVLVIDDDDTVHLRVNDILSTEPNLRVIGARSGDEGIAMVRSLQPDLVLLDLMMPGMDGFQVCQSIRRDPQTQYASIVILSAAADTENMLQAIRLGADDFLPKPIRADELKAKAATITRLRRYRALLEKQERLQWMTESSMDAFIFVDRNGTITFANQQAAVLLGCERAAMPGTSLEKLASPRLSADPTGIWQQISAGSLRHGQRFGLCRPENSLQLAHWYQAEVFTRVFGGADHALIRIVDATHGIRQGLHMWSFEDLLAHKIRTPLTGLTGTLHLMESMEQVKGSPELLQLVRMVKDSAERLKEDLLGVLEHHDAHEQLRKGRIDGHPSSIKALMELVRLSSEEEGIPAGLLAIRSGCPDDMMVRSGRAAPLAISEVVNNYAKFSGAAAKGLRVDIQPEGGQRIHLSFSAEGPELPDDLMDTLGQPYWQPERRFTGEIPGMGLGLSTARAMLQGIGGGLRLIKGKAPVGLVTEIILPVETPKS